MVTPRDIGKDAFLDGALSHHDGEESVAVGGDGLTLTVAVGGDSVVDGVDGELESDDGVADEVVVGIADYHLVVEGLRHLGDGGGGKSKEQ